MKLQSYKIYIKKYKLSYAVANHTNWQMVPEAKMANLDVIASPEINRPSQWKKMNGFNCLQVWCRIDQLDQQKKIRIFLNINCRQPKFVRNS